MSDTATIVLHAYDGARRLLGNSFKWRVKARNGRPKVEDPQPLYFLDLTGPSQILTVPYFGNYGDLYTVIASAAHYDDAAWYPVHVNRNARVELHLMLLPADGVPHFADATWARLQQARPAVAEIIRRGCASPDDAASKYGIVQEKRPFGLACLLNLMTALSALRLPSGKSPLDYYWNIAWPPGDPGDPAWLAALDQVLHQDRLFCYVQRDILPDVRSAVGHGFAEEPDPQAWGHTGATESYKQAQFDLANLQLTFHGNDTHVIDGVPCIKIEPDIDYYKDIAAHALGEVIPNWIAKGATDPRVVYWMRWMSAKSGRLPDFDPLYTIEVQSAAEKKSRRAERGG